MKKKPFGKSRDVGAGFPGCLCLESSLCGDYVIVNKV